MENRITREQFIEWFESQTQERLVSILDYGTGLLDTENRKTHIIHQMRKQRRAFEELGIPYEKDLDKLSLYDMSNCVLIGSGRCDRCGGLIARGIDYEEDEANP